MAFHYRVYGLDIAADLELPELAFSADAAAAVPPDLTVRLLGRREVGEPLQWLRKTSMPNGAPFLACGKTEDGYLLRYEGLADFAVERNGRAVCCVRRAPNVTSSTLRHLLLDHVLPMILELHGKQALHATAIATRYGACAFIGPTGAGKSTLAASFNRAGYPLLADDCLVLDERSSIFAAPAYPGLRLWKDSLDALGGEPCPRVPVAQYTSKSRVLDKGVNLARHAYPLARVYRVMRQDRDGGRAGGLQMVVMNARESLLELISSSFTLDPGARPTLTRQFRVFNRLIAQTPIVRLLIPNDFSVLPAVCEMILEDLGRSHSERHLRAEVA